MTQGIGTPGAGPMENGATKTVISGVKYDDGADGIDQSTNTIDVMQYEHHEIHAGSHYNYCDYELGVAIGTDIDFVMTTPDTTKEIHLTFELYASEGATLELYEGASSVVGGTSITPRNNNRTSSNTSVATLVKDPSSLTDGSRASGFIAGGGRTAGFSRRDKENVLARNTSYLVRITSLANSNDIGWCAEWYEHTPKN